MYVSQRDMQALSAVIGELDASAGIGAFSQRLLRLLHPLLPYDIATYNEIEPGAGRIHVIAEPAGALQVGGEALFMAHAADHPILQYTQEHRDGQALKLTDFLSQRQFHQRGIYREFFGPLGIEHQMVMTLPATPPLVIGVALNRARSDFGERERRLLNLLRPTSSVPTAMRSPGRGWGRACGRWSGGWRRRGAAWRWWGSGRSGRSSPRRRPAGCNSTSAGPPGRSYPRR